MRGKDKNLLLHGLLSGELGTTSPDLTPYDTFCRGITLDLDR